MSNPLDVKIYQVLNSARSHLNDELGLNWPDTRMIPKLQEAHRELRTKLALVGVEVVHEVSAIMTVPAYTNDDGVLDLSTVTGYPTDMIQPLSLKERQVGDMNIDFCDMTKVDFIPNTVKSYQLTFWSWQQETIIVLGSLVNTQVQIRYVRNIPTPQVATDTIGYIYGENYLSFRTAALCAASVGNNDKCTYLTSQADLNLSDVIRFNVKALQNMPAKRRPYHRGQGRSRVIRSI